jgi:hypothetical protein
MGETLEGKWNLELDGSCVPAYRPTGAIFDSLGHCETFSKRFYHGGPGSGHGHRGSGTLAFSPFLGSDAEARSDTPHNQWMPRGPDNPRLI